jgi:uncharacterized membrane protein
VLGLALQLGTEHIGRMWGDIGPLYGRRGIRPHHLPYTDRPLEYPVLIGYVMWATAWVGHTATTFLLTNAALLGALAVVTTVLLYRRDGARALRFAAAPSLVLYSFHNWDLIPVAATVAGLVALERRRPALAGVLLALGAWAKLYPGVLLAGIVILLWRRDDRATARRLVVGAAVTTAVVNLPVLVASWDGWWFPMRFQRARTATWGTLWFHVLRLPGIEGHHDLRSASVANVVGLVALVVAFTVVVRRAVRARVSPVQLAAALTVVVLLTNKVYSPQYTLWVVPFFVLLPLSGALWAGLIAADLAMYAVVFMGRDIAVDLRDQIIGVIAVARAVVLVRVAQTALRGRTDALAAAGERPASTS